MFRCTTAEKLRDSFQAEVRRFAVLSALVEASEVAVTLCITPVALTVHKDMVELVQLLRSSINCTIPLLYELGTGKSLS